MLDKMKNLMDKVMLGLLDAKSMGMVAEKVLSALHDPAKRSENLKAIQTETKESILARLKQKKVEAEAVNAERKKAVRKAEIEC